MSTGIDFGTTNSVVAQWNGTDVEVLTLDSEHLEDEWFYPSFEYLFPTIIGESSLRLGTLFGWEAKLRANRVIEACKRMLRDDGTVALRDRRVSATAAAAGVFKAMRERAEENLTTIDSAVITVPANAKGGARYRTRAAARAAGIQVKTLLNEPTAAALSYMHDIQDEGMIMVFDWGGGTIDVTILEHRDGVFEERASRGLTQLGGLEIDKRLRELIIRKIGRLPELSLEEERQFALAVERTKIRLSTEETVLTRVPGVKRLIEVSRPELEDAIQPLVEQALQPVRMCLNDLGLAPTAITDILLIGGTSQMPCVRAAVERLMDAEAVPAEICHPMTAVARGAAIAAAILDKKLDSYLQVSSMYALGTAVYESEHGDRKVFSEIIKARSPLPIREKKNYSPKTDFQPEVNIEIWEADPDKPLSDPENFQLTTLAVPGAPPPQSGLLHARIHLPAGRLAPRKGHPRPGRPGAGRPGDLRLHPRRVHLHRRDPAADDRAGRAPSPPVPRRGPAADHGPGRPGGRARTGPHSGRDTRHPGRRGALRPSGARGRRVEHRLVGARREGRRLPQPGAAPRGGGRAAGAVPRGHRRRDRGRRPDPPARGGRTRRAQEAHPFRPHHPSTRGHERKSRSAGRHPGRAQERRGGDERQLQGAAARVPLAARTRARPRRQQSGRRMDLPPPASRPAPVRRQRAMSGRPPASNR